MPNWMDFGLQRQLTGYKKLPSQPIQWIIITSLALYLKVIILDLQRDVKNYTLRMFWLFLIPWGVSKWNLLRNLVVIGESWQAGSPSLIVTVVFPVISAATKDGTSGGRAWVNPRTRRLRVLAFRPQASACFSVSPPAHPKKKDIFFIFELKNCLNNR